MSFIGFLLSMIIPLFVLASCVYLIIKLIKRWDQYKTYTWKMIGTILLIAAIMFIGAVFLLAAIAFTSVDILTRPASDPVFDIDTGVAHVDMVTKLGEYRAGSIWGSSGYSNDWMTLHHKMVYLDCYIEYYPLRTGSYPKMTLYCPGDYKKYIPYVNKPIFADGAYIDPSDCSSNCYHESDFTSRGYALPDENNTRVDIVSR